MRDLSCGDAPGISRDRDSARRLPALWQGEARAAGLPVLLINFNTLEAGTHQAQLYANGVPQGSSISFTVTVSAGEFLSGVSKQVPVSAFPRTGATTTLIWQQSQQNFAILSVGP